MEFIRKECFVAGGHNMEPPASATYAPMVSRDFVHVSLLIAALNGVDILSVGIKDAYLNA